MERTTPTLLEADARYTAAQALFGIAAGGGKPYFFDAAVFGRVLPRDDREDHDVVEQTITGDLIAWIRDNPKTFAPANPYYQKNPVSAPGTVRSWFRKMRAADFERVIYPLSRDCGYGGDWWFRKPWDVLDTRTVVDRETAAYYLKPDLGRLYFVQGGRVVGTINDIAWPWQTEYPQFSSTVPSGKARGITREDVERFIYDDDRRRADRRAAERRRSTCPKCDGTVRFAGAPVAYYGSRQCQLLYQYSKLLEADRRYTGAKLEIWLCDTCQIAGFL